MSLKTDMTGQEFITNQGGCIKENAVTIIQK